MAAVDGGALAGHPKGAVGAQPALEQLRRLHQRQRACAGSWVTHTTTWTPSLTTQGFGSAAQCCVPRFGPAHARAVPQPFAGVDEVCAFANDIMARRGHVLLVRPIEGSAPPESGAAPADVA